MDGPELKYFHSGFSVRNMNSYETEYTIGLFYLMKLIEIRGVIVVTNQRCHLVRVTTEIHWCGKQLVDARIAR